MFPEERRTKIMEMLQKQNRITNLELSKVLSVSESTVRRDLEELEQSASLKRTHGGAILYQSDYNEPSFTEKEVTLSEEKIYIASLAANYIEDGDSIILDSGTTTLQMVPFLLTKKIAIITNSVAIASIISLQDNIQLIMLGGNHRGITKSIVGSFADDMLDKLRVSKAFMGVNGLDFQFGATTPNMEEAKTKSMMIKAANEMFLLADNTKFSNPSMIKFANISEINFLITDKSTPDIIVSKLKNEGIQVIQ